MKEEENGNPRSLSSLYATLPAEAKGFLAFLLAFLLFLGSAMLLKPVFLEKQCWELQGKEGRFFKFNACNGEVIEITEQYLKPKR